MIRELVNRIIFDVVNQRDLDRANRAVDDSADNAREAAAASNRLRASASRLSSRLRSSLPSLRTFAQGVSRIGIRAAGMATRLGIAGAVGLGGFIANAVRLAATSEETRDRMRVALGDIADETDAWAVRTSNALGINRNQVRSFVTDFSLQLQRATDLASATDLGRALTERAFDLESFQDVPIDEVFAAFRSGINGSTEPLDRFNVNLRASAVDAFILANGLAASSDAITENTRRLARAQLILRETSNAQGNLSLTSTSFTNTFRRFGNILTNLFTDIGDRFLPSARELFQFLIDTVRSNQDNIVDFFTRLANRVQQFIENGGLQTIARLLQEVADVAIAAGRGIGTLFDTFTTSDTEREFNRRLREEAPLPAGLFATPGQEARARQRVADDLGTTLRGDRIIDSRRFTNPTNNNNNQSVTQNVSVTVNGSSDPAQTRRAVQSGVARANRGTLLDAAVFSPASN